LKEHDKRNSIKILEHLSKLKTYKGLMRGIKDEVPKFFSAQDSGVLFFDYI
jgi:hypothetical protein